MSKQEQPLLVGQWACSPKSGIEGVSSNLLKCFWKNCCAYLHKQQPQKEESPYRATLQKLTPNS